MAAPTYFLSANASLKRFVDRSFALYARIDSLLGTPSVGICIAGIPGKEGHGLLGVENFLKMIFTDSKMTRVVYGALPGEVFLNEENRSTAVELGKDWLIGMKSRFVEKKDALKAVSVGYREGGTWIKPPE